MMIGDLNILYVVLGSISVLLGVGMLLVAMRGRGDPQNPKATAMLIAGMMVTAFGLLMAGFAIGFAAAPLPWEREGPNATALGG
jgi:hypothetical protein